MTYHKKLEGALQDKVLSYIKPMRDVWVLNTYGNAVQRSGVPDLILCIRGKFVAFELKRPDGTGRATGQQLIEIRKINSAGGFAIISDDYDEIIGIIEAIRKEP